MALPRQARFLPSLSLYDVYVVGPVCSGTAAADKQRVWLSKSSLPYGSRKRSGGEASTSSPPTSAPKKDLSTISYPLLASTHRSIISTIGRDLVLSVGSIEDASTFFVGRLSLRRAGFHRFRTHALLHGYEECKNNSGCPGGGGETFTVTGPG